MPRFFKTFLAADPMSELSEADARATGTFVEEVVLDKAPRHFVATLRGVVDRVIYPDAEPSPAIESFHREHYPGVALWITSTVNRDGHHRSFRAWHHDSTGALIRSVAYDFSPETEESITYGPDGALLGRMVEYYDAAGALVRSIVYDAAGKSHEYLPD
jgi:hypothetical protein